MQEDFTTGHESVNDFASIGRFGVKKQVIEWARTVY